MLAEPVRLKWLNAVFLLFTVYMSMGMLAEPVRLKWFNAVFLKFTVYISLSMLAEPVRLSNALIIKLTVGRNNPSLNVCEGSSISL